MAYTNETTHYSIPLPLGSDLTTPMDYNTAMQTVDTALFESKTDSSSALQKANQLQLDLASTNDEVTAVKGRVTSLEGTTTTQGQAIIQNTQDIADVRADALDIIVAKDEGTAQVATVAVTKGEYFRYNDVLYIATSNIANGDTIVPNENCRATNVGTELTQLNSDLANKVNTSDILRDGATNLYARLLTETGPLNINGKNIGDASAQTGVLQIRANSPTASLVLETILTSNNEALFNYVGHILVQSKTHGEQWSTLTDLTTSN